MNFLVERVANGAQERNRAKKFMRTKKKTNKRNSLTQRIQTIQNNLRKNGVKVSMPDIRKWFHYQLKVQVYKCQICNKDIEHEDDMGLDHINPLSRGGKPGLENCHLVHKECNRIKGDFSLEEIRELMSIDPETWKILKNRLKRSTLVFVSKY